MKLYLNRPGASALVFFSALAVTTFSAELQVLLPLNRTEYQTNERIDVSVVRSNPQALTAGDLVLTLTGADGAALAFTFAVGDVAVIGDNARTTEHLHLNGWLLRPGAYQLQAAADGATAETAITLYSHLRRSSYRTIHWGGPGGEAMVPEGPDGMGFNLILTGNVKDQVPSLRAGVDVMGVCLMGGGHQHDLRLTNDWSDPYVYLGAIQRGVDRAFSFRTLPNAIGAHLHDEPGLTWQKHPRLKDAAGNPLFGPHDIPQQRQAYSRAFGAEPIALDEADTADPRKLAQWVQVNDFRLGFMDAFWKASREALERMKPGYLPVTQSQYGWSALYDGYYFNVARSLPIISGHGGYNDFWLRNFNPSFFLEMSLPRQLDKPTWYLPEWYGNISPAGFRLEHNLSFITGIQGMSTPPGLNIKSPAAPAITECNQLFARIGTIFAKPAYTRQPLTLLYSKSNALFNKAHTQMGDLAAVYMATKLIQYPLSVVLDEDIIDGSLATAHRAVIVAGINYLDPAVVTGLEAFAKGGGLVLTTADTTVAIAGATPLAIVPEALATAAREALKQITDEDEVKAATLKANSFRAQLEYAAPTAAALKSALTAAGIEPAFGSDLQTLCAGRQLRGEIEYVFAVNFTPAEGYGADVGGYGEPIAARAQLTVPAGERPIYDVIRGGRVDGLAKQAASYTGSLDFGPGEMRVFALTARPLGGVRAGQPIVSRDLTREQSPVRVECVAALLDNQNGILAGTAPLQVRLLDPAGAVRYELYRATDNGVCTLSLPLAANDTAGTWTLEVTELLANTKATATFAYQPSAQCGAAAGKTHRAVFFPADKPNIYRFFRDQRQIVIVPGSSDYAAAAATRLAGILAPYNVQATILPLAEANRPRPLSEVEAATWCGTWSAGSLKPGRDNDPRVVGYDLAAPAVLLGNAQDNPLIARLVQDAVLPYAPTADFPGRGRGMLAWNLMTLGHDQETVVCIANDAAGLDEAVGTLFQTAAGLDPVTPLILPTNSSVTIPGP